MGHKFIEVDLHKYSNHDFAKLAHIDNVLGVG